MGRYLWRQTLGTIRRSRRVVVRDVLRQDRRQPGFIHDDHVIEALSSNGADQDHLGLTITTAAAIVSKPSTGRPTVCDRLA
jgi:hypothetical protein